MPSSLAKGDVPHWECSVAYGYLLLGLNVYFFFPHQSHSYATGHDTPASFTPLSKLLYRILIQLF